jgi:uncharacterized protein YqfA (UPF0365 family)
LKKWQLMVAVIAVVVVIAIAILTTMVPVAP